MKWLIPAAAVFAAIRLAAPAKADDRTQDEADQGIGTCPRPGGPGTHRAAPNSVRRMIQMLTRRDLEEQDRRRLTIPYGLLTSPYGLLTSCSSLPLHFPTIGCQLCGYSTSATQVANIRRLNRRKSQVVLQEHHKPTLSLILDVPKVLPQKIEDLDHQNLHRRCAAAVSDKLRPQTPGPPNARALGLPLRAPQRWRGVGRDFGPAFASLVAKNCRLCQPENVPRSVKGPKLSETRWGRSHRRREARGDKAELTLPALGVPRL